MKSPTCILSSLGCLSLCHSVANKPSRLLFEAQSLRIQSGIQIWDLSISRPLLCHLSYRASVIQININQTNSSVKMCSQSPVKLELVTLLHVSFSHYCNPLSCVFAIHYLALLQSIISRYCNPLS